MDILDKMPIIVEAETINQVYLKLISKFTSKEDRYESRSAFVNIKNVYISELPNNVIEPFNKYYGIFVQNTLLEQKWDMSDNEWYLSYARRIMSERNGINLWEKAKQELIKDKNSRRAIVLTYRDDDDVLSFLPSLLSIQFTIEHDRMNMVSIWRSKELYTAFPVNTLSMLSLMRIMFNELRKHYNMLRIGIYTEMIGSLHKLPNYKKPKQFGDCLVDMDLEKVKFYWSVLERGKENEYDSNY